MKLRATSVRDVHFLSGFLQGSILKINHYLYENQTMHLLLHRFRWEKEMEDLRCNSLLKFKNVSNVSFPKFRNAHVAILAMIFLNSNKIRIYCTHKIIIELDISKIDIFLSDISLSWPSRKPFFEDITN
jgi:hypothetical protein